MKYLFNRFKIAGYGLIYLIKTEENIKVHMAIATLTISFSFALSLDALEWIAVVFTVGLVIALEIMNTVVEKICDFIHPTYHPDIGVIKDISAGAVLFVSVIGASIGLIVFIPKLLHIYYSLLNNSLAI